MQPQQFVPLHRRVMVSSLMDNPALFVKPWHMEARCIGAAGIVIGTVPGCGGDAWWVQHDDGAIGAYLFTELEFCDFATS